MEESNPGTSGAQADAAAAPTSFAQRLIGIYFEPTRTFAEVSRNRSWLGIFIILAVLAMGMSYVLNTRIDRETRIRKSLEMSPIKIPEEKKEEVVKAALEREPGIMERFNFVFAPISIFVIYLIVAAALLLVFVLMGAGLTFKDTLTVSWWGMGPPGIIFTVLSIVLMYLKDPDKLELDPSMNVASNLGILVADHKAHPVLASLLSSIDVFTFWSIALLSIGFAAFSNGKLTTKKAATSVIGLWLLWVLGKAGYRAIAG